MKDPGDPEISGAPEMVGAFLHEFEFSFEEATILSTFGWNCFSLL